MGRPTKLTREIIRKIADNIYPAGNYFEVACELAGISASTGYEWLQMARGEKPRRRGVPADLLSELLDAVSKANAEVESAAVLSWRTAFSQDWRSAAEYLARRFPERWKKVERQEVTGADGGDIPIRLMTINMGHNEAAAPD